MDDAIKLPSEADMPLASNSLWRWLYFFLKPYRRTFVLFATLRVVRYTVLAMLPFVIGTAVNGFEQGWAFADPSRLMWQVWPYFMLYGFALYTMRFFIPEATMEDRLVRSMTLYAVQFMNHLPLDWHEAQGSGSKLQRVMNARYALKQLYTMYKWTLTPFIGGLIGIACSVALIHAPAYYFLLYVGFAASFMVAASLLVRPLNDLHDKHNRLMEGLLARVYEFVSAVRTVKAFHMEDYITRQAGRHELSAHNAMRDVIGVSVRKWTALNMTAFAWLAIFVAACMHDVLRHAMSVGAFATIFFLATQLWTRLEDMVYLQDQFVEYRNGFMRLTETLKSRPAPVDLLPALSLPDFWQNLQFNKVDFIYGGQDTPAIRGLDLTIRRGEKIALVGPSGAGKSTLVRLLVKQMLPESGRITVDDTDLAYVPSGAWLPRIGFVPQEVELFNMSVRDNILLDRMDHADDALYGSALRQAALDSMIGSLPDGDATLVGERGIKLSGGQRQRLGIARALVRQAELIVFDEATSALDSLSEDVIQDALRTAFADHTMVIIAHRLSTVRFADRIIVLDGGRLVEEGSFEELNSRNGLFAKLWLMQSSGFEKATSSIGMPAEAGGRPAGI